MDSHFVWHVIHCVRDLMEHRMRGSIAVRVDCSVSDLRKLARQEKNGRVVLRLTAIASVLEGASRQDAASHSGMDRQTLCDWVHRFNAQGPEGLRDAPCGHPKKRLTPEQEKAVKARVLKGPDPKKDGYPIHTIPLAICAPYLMAWYFWSPLAKVAGPGLL